MLARPKVVSGSGARNYFEKDTYYQSNEFEQGSFYGKLSEDLGLKNKAFNLEDFDALLRASHPTTGEQLLNLSKKDLDENGDRIKAAIDMTFAADKSISILYEISTEEEKAKLRLAFSKSIDKSLDFAESNYAKYQAKGKREGASAQNKLMFVRFDHSENRNDDMHLHQHCLAINLVRDNQGQWRGLENNQIMMNHQLIGQVQRNEFAKELQRLGYEVEITDIKVGSFKLKNIEKSLSKEFSTRSEDIKKEMQKSGQTSYQATHTAQKQTAKWKDKNKDREAIQETNIKKLLETGANLEKIQEKKEDLKIKSLNPKEILELAFIDITDKNSVFKKEDILKQALKIALTSDISIQDLQKEFENYKELITINAEKNQYTTVEILEKEDYIFSNARNQTFNISSDKNYIESKIKEFETERNFELKSAQSELVHTILSDNSKYIIAQGVAGAGKSTAFEIINTVANELNIKILALAPTGTATDNLAKEANIKESYTLAKFIQENGMDIKDALIVVDEAGMMGLRDTHSLFEIAKKNNLKIVFSGDKSQKKAIQQGDIFASMQKQGFTTVNIAEGNRQKTEILKQAVSKILEKDITGALETLQDTTVEITNSKERLEFAKDEYLKDRKNSLLITTTNEDRVALNLMIRNKLVLNGEITNSQTFDTREIPSMSALEKRSALYYQESEKVYLSKNLGSISAGREATIKEVNQENNTLTIEHTFKNKTFTEIIDLTKDGVSLNLFKETKSSFGIGEQIITKKNDNKLGLKNGEIGEITSVSKDEITVKFEKKEVKINLKNYPYIQHAYAITDFASQGKTTDKVIAVANSQAASLNDFYTQITRAKFEAHVITDNLQELQQKAAQDSSKLNARELLDEFEKIQKNSIINKEKDITTPVEVLESSNIDYKKSSISINEMKQEDQKIVESQINSKHKHINKEYTNKQKEIKKVFRVDIKTRHEKGADINFSKSIESLKSMTIENKDYSLLTSQSEKTEKVEFEITRPITELQELKKQATEKSNNKDIQANSELSNLEQNSLATNDDLEELFQEHTQKDVDEALNYYKKTNKKEIDFK